MRDDLAWLEDIRDSLTRLQEWSASEDAEGAFRARGMLYAAILREFTVIGEAVKHLSPQTTAVDGVVPWRELAAFRDVIVHNYFGIRDEVVWDGVTNVVPELLDQIISMVAARRAAPSP